MTHEYLELNASKDMKHLPIAMPDCHTVINIDMKVITKKHA